MIRCIAMDLDDTLLSSDLTISEENQSSIKQAVQAGVKVLLASGRMVQSMKPYVEMLGLDVPLIAYNGAIIQEAISGQILYHRPVPSELAVKLVPIFREAGIHLNAYLKDELYMDELTEWGQIYANNAGVTPHPVGDLSVYLKKDPPHKMLGVGEITAVDRIQNRLREEFGTTLQFLKSKPTYLEIIAPDVSKGLALKELATIWGLEPGEVMAIGDAPNDLPMITWAGTGVAVGNAANVVKEAATLVVADHNHNGVAEAINKMVFGR